MTDSSAGTNRPDLPARWPVQFGRHVVRMLCTAFDPLPKEHAVSASFRALPLLLGMVVLFSLFRYSHGLLKFLLESPFIDFAHYYTYAKVVALGLNPFDAQAVAQVDAALNIRRAGAAPNYPPLFYLLMQPWVHLPFRAAAIGWLLASQACLALVLWFCIHRYGEASPLQNSIEFMTTMSHRYTRL